MALITTQSAQDLELHPGDAVCAMIKINVGLRGRRRMTKTNAARLLDSAGIHYELREYEVDENDLSAPHVAEMIGMPPEQVFKTLVARGDRTGVLMGCIPANTELDLKALANASGNKKVELVAVKEVLPLTGYISRRCLAGGLAANRTRSISTSTADIWDIIPVSAGARGCQMLIAPDDLVRATGAERCAIAISAEVMPFRYRAATARERFRLSRSELLSAGA